MRGERGRALTRVKPVFNRVRTALVLETSSSRPPRDCPLRPGGWRILGLGPGAELLERQGAKLRRPGATPGVPFQARSGLGWASGGWSGRICNGLILDWASWQRENGEAFGQLTSVLRALSPSLDEPLTPGKLTRISVEDAVISPRCRFPTGKRYALARIRRDEEEDRLSTRVLAGVDLAGTLYEACEIRGKKPAREIIFLIDEIEAHLHPQWQRRIVKALLDVAGDPDGNPAAVSVQMIATTHSPLVLASRSRPYFSPDQGCDLV